MVQILDLVSSNLETLEILGPTCHQYFHDEAFTQTIDNGHHTLIESNLRTMNIHFASLTHIRITRKVLRYVESVAIICNSAPSLISLDVSLDSLCGLSDGDDDKFSIPKLAGTTRLRYLQLNDCDDVEGVAAVLSQR